MISFGTNIATDDSAAKAAELWKLSQEVKDAADQMAANGHSFDTSKLPNPFWNANDEIAWRVRLLAQLPEWKLINPNALEESEAFDKKFRFERMLRRQTLMADAQRLLNERSEAQKALDKQRNAPASIDENIAVIERVRKVRQRLDLDAAIPPVLEFMRAGKDVKLTPDSSQWHAIKSLAHEQYGCLTGAAGTGKTTVERALVQTIEDQYHRIDIRAYGRGWKAEDDELEAVRVLPIAFCAYTGKAMQQMKRALPSEYHKQCKTIHSLLGFHPEYEDWFDEVEQKLKTRKKFVPYYTKAIKMPWQVIYVDEASMVPIHLWNQLIDACLPDCRIFLIGDINQLPPVHGRSVFGFSMLEWPSFELTQIHRQKGEDNPIVDNAWRILRGEKPINVPDKFDLVMVEDSKSLAQSRIIKVVKRLHSRGEFDPYKSNDIIITSQNVDDLGQKELNQLLIPYFNPPPAPSDATQVGRRVLVTHGIGKRLFAINDKVMATVNNHDINVTNGMTGIIIDIHANGNYKDKKLKHHSSDDEVKLAMMLSGDGAFALTMPEAKEETAPEEKEPDEIKSRAASHVISVDFGELEDGSRHVVDFSSAGEVDSLIHAFAATCHKLQGSEAPVTIIICHSSNHRMLYREWLYTAVTRAIGRVVLCFDAKGLNMALNRQKIVGKNLKEKAQAFIKLQEESSKKGLDVAMPLLPKARKVKLGAPVTHMDERELEPEEAF